MGKIACRYALLFVAALPSCSLAGGAGSPSLDTGRQRALEYGALALDAGDFPAAAERLAPVAAICPVDELGRRAMLLLAAAELDGRNPEGRPQVAAELAAFQLARVDEEWEGTLASHLYVIALDFGAEPIAAEDVPGAGVIWTRYLTDEGEPATARAPVQDSGRAPIGVDTSVARAPGGVPAAEATRQVQGQADAGPRCDVPRRAPGLVMPVLERTPLARRTAPAAPAGQQPAAALPTDVRGLQAEIERLRGEIARKDQELDRIRRTLRP